MNAKPNSERFGFDYCDDEFGMNQMINTIQNKAEDLKVNCVHRYDPVHFEKDCPMVKALQNAYEKITQMDGTPVTTTGGTYAKLMPHIVPFGPSFPGQKGIGHQPNEWMKVDDIIMNAKIYALGIYYLANL